MKKKLLLGFTFSLFLLNISVIDALDIRNSGQDYQTGITGSGQAVNLNSPNAAGSPTYISPSQIDDYKRDGYNVVPGSKDEYIAYIPKNQTSSEKNFDISGNIYQTENGDNAFCLTPGQKFRGGDFTQTGFDASIYKYSNEDSLSRVSWILSQTDYSYADRLTAARAVLAGTSNFAGGDSFGLGDGYSSKWEGVYGDIFDVATSGSSGSISMIDSNSFSKNMFYKKAGISLNFFANKILTDVTSGYSSVTNVTNLINSSGKPQNMNINPGIDLSKYGFNNASINVSTSSNTINIPLNVDDPEFAPYKDQIKIEIGRYEDGKWKKITDLSDCQKNACMMEKMNLCSGSKSTTTDDYKIRITVPGTTEGGGVQMYVNSGNPDNTQIMMVVPGDKVSKSSTDGTGKDKDEIEKQDTVIETDVTINCIKDCTVSDGVHCPSSEMKPHTDSGLSCESVDAFGENPYDTYTKGIAEDPYMNCIVNSCDDSLKQEFRQKGYEPDGGQTCAIYCRSETEFYMANKTKVYAGMQFEYDIKDKVPFQTQGDKKLSAVVFQKKQCTSEIFYDRAPSAVSAEYSGNKSWLQRYAEATKAMVNAWNEWKKWEALKIKWESKKINKPASDLIVHGYSCSGCSCWNSGECGPTPYIYKWGPEPYKAAEEAQYGSYSGKNQPKNAGQLNTKIQITSNPNRTANASSGSTPVAGTTHCSYSPYTYDKKGNISGGGKCTDCSGTSCKPGVIGDGKLVINNESSSRSAYEQAAKYVQELISAIKSCSLYGDVSAPSLGDIIGGYSGTSAIGAIKGDAIQNDIGLFVGYDDKNYGETVEFGAEKASSKDEQYYCQNGSDEENLGDSSDCYQYSSSEREVKGSDKKDNHTYVYCSGNLTGANCVDKSINLPINDYSTYIMEEEVNFFRNVPYYTKAYTGNVYKGSVSNDKNVNGANLPSTIFPVSNDKQSGSTGLYGINWNFTNVGLFRPTKVRNFLYNCSYEVYNTTTLYDCPYLDENGNIDWEKCNNPCYNLDGGPVPDICIDKFAPTDSKGYGFIYRNVDLKNLFPGERIIGNNWSKAADIINNIQSNANEIWTDKYLEYSFTLTQQTINNIRNYNSTKNGIGGYLDNSIYACEKDEKNAFIDCRSSFLDLYNLNDSLGIKINKYGRIN